MAMSLTRAVSSFTRKVVSIATKDVAKMSSFAPSVSRCYTILHRRPFANTELNRAAFGLTKCANLHTEGDRRFVEVLNEEISEEKKRLIEVPGMSDGWKITFEGAAGTLSKTHDGDQIEVSFSLNQSIPPLDEQEMEEEDETSMISYPEFNVKVTKPGNRKVIEFECYFPDDVQNDMQEQSMNIFSVRSIVVYEGEISDDTYIIETENLDPEVYSYFLSYLADRSVDQQFAEEFIQLTTAAEQQEYVKSLQKLKDFIASK